MSFAGLILSMIYAKQWQASNPPLGSGSLWSQPVLDNIRTGLKIRRGCQSSLTSYTHDYRKWRVRGSST